MGLLTYSILFPVSFIYVNFFLVDTKCWNPYNVSVWWSFFILDVIVWFGKGYLMINCHSINSSWTVLLVGPSSETTQKHLLWKLSHHKWSDSTEYFIYLVPVYSTLISVVGTDVNVQESFTIYYSGDWLINLLRMSMTKFMYFDYDKMIKAI